MRKREQFFLLTVLVLGLLSAGCGGDAAAEGEPFFISEEAAGIPALTLYYNEKTETGIGFLGEEPCTAFGFSGVVSASEGMQGVWERWETAGAVPPMGEPVEIKGYHAEREYDTAGRLIRFRSYGDLSDIGQPEEAWITDAEYAYSENGVLRRRKWARNPWANEAGTTYLSIESCFDLLGRVAYENCYITHGSMEFYYIYEGDSMDPVYCLFLDLEWREAGLIRYKAD